jgi:hypothetical protein
VNIYSELLTVFLASVDFVRIYFPFLQSHNAKLDKMSRLVTSLRSLDEGRVECKSAYQLVFVAPLMLDHEVEITTEF